MDHENWRKKIIAFGWRNINPDNPTVLLTGHLTYFWIWFSTLSCATYFQMALLLTWNRRLGYNCFSLSSLLVLKSVSLHHTDYALEYYHVNSWNLQTKEVNILISMYRLHLGLLLCNSFTEICGFPLIFIFVSEPNKLLEGQ